MTTPTIIITDEHSNIGLKNGPNPIEGCSDSKNQMTPNDDISPNSFPKLYFQKFKPPSRTSSQPHSLVYVPESSKLNPIKKKRSLSNRKLSLGDKNENESKFVKISKSGVCSYNLNGKKLIFGGTLRKILSRILNWLVTNDKRDNIIGTMNAFINGYRLMYTPTEILNAVISFWNKQTISSSGESSVEITRSAIMLFLSFWWEARIEVDFVDESDIYMKKWLNSIPEMYSKALFSKYIKLLQSRQTTEASINLLKSQTLSKITNNISLLQINTDSFVEHLLFYDMNNFMSIPQSEIYSSKRPKWNRMLEKSATLTKWIVGSIVEIDSLSTRAKAIKKTLKIIKKLLLVNNFNGAMCFWAGINTDSVSRLSKTKKKLSNSSLDMWKDYELLFLESNNFFNLRHSIEVCIKQNSPFVPWLELMNKGRNMIDEYPSTFNVNISKDSKYINTPIINFSKFERLNESVKEFATCHNINKKVNLNIEPNCSLNIFQDLLESLPNYSDSELWNMSLKCEREELLL